MPQLAVVVTEEMQSQDAVRKVITCKHAAAATAVEQPCDTSAAFRTMKRLETVNIADTQSCVVLQSLVRRVFRDNEDKLKLRAANQRVLIEFLARVPALMTRAATPSVIMNGFIEAGLLDKETRSMPDFRALLGTMSRPVTLKEEKLCDSKFNELYQYQVEHGHIPGDVLLAAGFPCDRDSQGNPEHRLATVANESSQRAKCLSSEFQRHLRHQRLVDLQEARTASVAKLTQRYEKLIDFNRRCEVALRVQAPEGPYTFEQLANVRGPELQAFIHWWRKKTVAGSTGAAAKINKGTAADAASGKDCLVLRAFQSQGDVVIMERPTMTSILQLITPLQPVLIDTDTSAEAVAASLLLEDEAWVTRATMALALPIDPKRNSMRAGHLASLLKQRLDRHLLTKVKTASKRTPPVWLFVQDNIPQVAAFIELQGHARQDLASATRETDLLRGPEAFVSCEQGPISRLMGAYVYYDTQNRVFVRSGKTDRTFFDRHEEHRRGASLKTVEHLASHFYTYAARCPRAPTDAHMSN